MYENKDNDSPIAPELIQWYRIHKRDLPWRHTADPYRIWISEIILQQTRVAQGLDYYIRFISRFPDIVSLAEADNDEVMKYWQGLGYYSRARNLHAAARFMAEKYAGRFPKTYKEVLGLKGIGEYTAAAICSFSYGLPYATVDGNVYRVLSRLFAIDTPIDSTQGKKLFSGLANELLDRKNPGEYNQALMEFGALHCLPRSPKCNECPLSGKCLAYAEGQTEKYPLKQTKAIVKPRYFNYFHIILEDKTWIHRRNGNDIWRNLYEFPLIETDWEMNLNEIQKTPGYKELFTGINTLYIQSIPYVCRHVLSHRIINAKFYTIYISCSGEHLDAYKCIENSSIGDYAVARLTESYLEKVWQDILSKK